VGPSAKGEKRIVHAARKQNKVDRKRGGKVRIWWHGAKQLILFTGDRGEREEGPTASEEKRCACSWQNRKRKIIHIENKEKRGKWNLSSSRKGNFDTANLLRRRGEDRLFLVVIGHCGWISKGAGRYSFGGILSSPYFPIAFLPGYSRLPEGSGGRRGKKKQAHQWSRPLTLKPLNMVGKTRGKKGGIKKVRTPLQSTIQESRRHTVRSSKQRRVGEKSNESRVSSGHKNAKSTRKSAGEVLKE